MSEMMSQKEIEALFAQSQSSTQMQEKPILSEMEVDALGEIGNISMGAAATALYTIIDRNVVITTPEVSVTTTDNLADAQEVPYLVVVVEYTEGFVGNNLYVLRLDDVKAITDIMMGGSGEVTKEDLSELHISAISEAMNQMAGGMATSMAEMFNRTVNISPPKTMIVHLVDDEIRNLVEDPESRLIQIRFRMEIEGLDDSSVMQLIPLEFGKQLVRSMLGEADDNRMEQDSNPATTSVDAPAQTMYDQDQSELQSIAQMTAPSASNPAHDSSARQQQVDVRPIQLSDFDHHDEGNGTNENGIDIILDVPLQVSVVLGQSRKTIKEVMDLNIGSIVTLDRVAGEPVDVVVNGKVVARGEVIVIDDNYGIRIMEVITSKRVRASR